MREIYFETDHVQIWFEENQQRGGAVWKGFLPSAAFREAFLKCSQVITEKNLRHWVADNRKMEMMSQQDLEWAHLMAPAVMTSSLRKMATIVSEDVFHHMAIIDLFDKASGMLTFQNHYFRNETDAENWLAGEPEKQNIAPVKKLNV